MSKSTVSKSEIPLMNADLYQPVLEFLISISNFQSVKVFKEIVFLIILLLTDISFIIS